MLPKIKFTVEGQIYQTNSTAIASFVTVKKKLQSLVVWLALLQITKYNTNELDKNITCFFITIGLNAQIWFDHGHNIFFTIGMNSAIQIS
jgi:hypothetical protein